MNSLKQMVFKCDNLNCDWKLKITKNIGQSITKWHNKLCPKCKQSIIIDNKDRWFFIFVISILKISNWFTKIYKFIFKKEPKTKEIIISTDLFRKD